MKHVLVLVVLAFLAVLVPSRDAAEINSVPFVDSFEGYSVGASIDGVNGWKTAPLSAAIVTNIGYTYDTNNCPLPLDANHTQVLSFDSPVINCVEADRDRKVYLDMMVRPDLLWTGAVPPAVEDTANTAVYINTDGHLVVAHREYGTSTNIMWTELADTSIGTGEWHRLTFILNYAYEDRTNHHLYCEIVLDGDTLTNANARTGCDGGGPGGSWFPMINTAPLAQCSVRDFGCLDDFAVIPSSDICVFGGDLPIANGNVTPNVDNGTDFGMTFPGATNERAFIIFNRGSQALMLTGTPSVAVGGPSDFTVGAQPAATEIAVGGSVAFSVRFAPVGEGIVTSTVTIGNSSGDDDPYTFCIKGHAPPEYTTNGTPSLWLYNHGLIVNDGNDADWSDTDGDGMFAWQEYRAGTVPTNDMSVLIFTDNAPRPGSDEFVISWRAATGKSYAVLTSTNLLAGSWSTNASGIPGVEPECAHTVNVNSVQTFFKIHLE